MSASRECGSSNFAAFMQTHGFQMDRKAYLDGPFKLIDWTNLADLNGAIANIGPVKIGVASGGLSAGPHGKPDAWNERLGDLRPPAGPSRRSVRKPFRLRAPGRDGRLSSGGTGSMSPRRRACLRASLTRYSAPARSG